MFCTPEYAGTLPGSLKNSLDWTVGGGEMDANRARGARLRWPGRGHGHPRRPRGGAGRPCPLTGFSRTETCLRLFGGAEGVADHLVPAHQPHPRPARSRTRDRSG
ncbi:MAG TPA: NAD(P)H-dependent oxidoreductase [Streptosporangiaceae bacterium]